jgi:nicotinate phosphoribosyltransferase
MRLLDTDIYKLTMQQAIMQHYPRAEAEYELIVRAPVAWPERFARLFGEIESALVGNMGTLLGIELAGLRRAAPFLTPAYLDFLGGYRFDMDEVIECERSADGSSLRLAVSGPWYRTVLWEVPLMALISELYHRETTGKLDVARDCEMFERAIRKAEQIALKGIQVVEGGTRRRHCYDVHREVLRRLQRVRRDMQVPTTNVALALDEKLPCVGTVAHEWTMFHGAAFGYRGANRLALQRWVDTYQGALGIALSDTYSTTAFLEEFDPLLARIYDGVRQDSGKPLDFAERMIAHYEKAGIDPRSKTIVFSDGLSVEKAVAIRDALRDRIQARFLIGTDLTCDVPGVTPLNMVIKMTHCRLDPSQPWRATVKLSDVPTKHTGSAEEVDRCKMDLGIG